MRRNPVLYDFLKVTDEVLDVRAPQLARLLSASGRKVSPGDALALILQLERYVVRRVNDEAPDLEAEFRACAFLPHARTADTLSVAVGWPLSRAEALGAAFADPDVAVLEAAEGGWRVRGVVERYARFALERRSSRNRTRDNARARAAGWLPGDGGSWAHAETGEVAKSLKDVISRL